MADAFLTHLKCSMTLFWTSFAKDIARMGIDLIFSAIDHLIVPLTPSAVPKTLPHP